MILRRNSVRLMSSNAHRPLPRLPIPPLRKSLDRYLASIKPLLLSDEARGGQPFKVSYAKRVKLAEDFELGVGKVCQERLIALDKVSPNNWLDDNIWLDNAYLQQRAPLLINSNWWLALINDETVPAEVLRLPTMGITPWQIRRASALVYGVLDFKRRLEIDEIYPETTRSSVWLRNSVSKMFCNGRIPEMDCDTLFVPYNDASPSPPESVPKQSPPKLLVLCHDWYYSVDVYTDTEVPSPVRVSLIETRLRAVVADVQNRLRNGERAIPIGVLSADNRDTWAQNLRHLLSSSDTNKTVHSTILDSVFCLCLDHWTYTGSSKKDVLNVDTAEEIDEHLHNARSAVSPNHSDNSLSNYARNRFYDKTFSLVVESNTRASAVGEHSPVDALVPSIVAEYAVVQRIDESAFEGPPAAIPLDPASTDGWKRLDWVADEFIQTECEMAELRAKELIDNSDDSLMLYTEYGSEWIKNTAKLSPDAYIQMALQLAWYKTRGEFTATYETALTRIFHHGRTETIRTLTTDSRAWVLSMVQQNSSQTMRHLLLRQAVETHSLLTREAATGKGIDRHLLGLKLMLRPSTMESSPLLESDELFERSSRWKLSTSGLSAGYQFRGTGFGSPYEDGYGINYLAALDVIKFGIESKKSCQLTSTDGFKETLAEVLNDMRNLCSENMVETPEVIARL